MREADGTGQHLGRGTPEQGLYLFVETQVPETVSNTTAPFLLSLPMTSIDGMNWNYDVTVYPKTSALRRHLKKMLRESKADTAKTTARINHRRLFILFSPPGSIGDGSGVPDPLLRFAVDHVPRHLFLQYTYTDTSSSRAFVP